MLVRCCVRICRNRTKAQSSGPGSLTKYNNKALEKKSTRKYIIVNYEKKQGKYQTKKSYLKR